MKKVLKNNTQNTNTICITGGEKKYKDGEGRGARRVVVKIGRRETSDLMRTELEDGSTLLTFSDGRQAQIFPDGVYVSIHPSCKIQIHPDGTTIREMSDGVAILTRPDGMSGLYKSANQDDEPIPFHLSTTTSSSFDDE